ncbi:type II toxin-antitoxin system RelE/ParE family toxin [Marivirga sp.]|uniref:type II toxin-antitoxin system RelE/ParE family toxin n=1 Tax=Marivirga sp. TaxID=2018662 RepID=UPI002D7E252E|nr:type II toxin-antitoxin system RelE/ParE family toxin [Marivirga sp.]HET8858743.1 type II toxin-antitoxin system RelE/ParE family toxin [Marivirga sp.]
MSYKVETTEHFDKEVKKLAKKYVSIKSDLIELFDDLSENPTKGTSLGNNIYKIRLAIRSIGKGKRSGARVISLVKIESEKVYMVSIYIKSKKSNITDQEIKTLIERNFGESS